MPYAVTHVILTIVIADIYRDYFAKEIPDDLCSYCRDCRTSS